MTRLLPRLTAAAALSVALVATSHRVANAAPSDSTPPKLIPLLTGYTAFWVSNGNNDLHGTVVDPLGPATLQRDDRLVVWINRHATPEQRFKALQDSLYQNAGNTAYDQSFTVSTGMGSLLSKYYVEGRNSGALPLTSALINSSNGTTGAYVSTSAAKAYFSHPRPYLPSNADAAPVPGDAAGCAPSIVNGSSQRSIRLGQPWADAAGNLKIKRVAPEFDTTRQFSPNSVAMDPGYGTTGLCTGGSFPSGHTTTAYEAGITLATFVPERAPEILTRASEAGIDRNVLGVHYPLDIVGGRIDGEAALAHRWADSQFRAEVLEPARAELRGYLAQRCGGTIQLCLDQQKGYRSNPFAGAAMPGGTAQVVADRRSALAVYRERMTYGFAPTEATGLAPAVPAEAGDLLLTTYPTLTEAQRTSVLAQTQIPSGAPLDQTALGNGSWQRLDLAAATSAKVKVLKDGSIKVVSVGGKAVVVGP